MNIILTLNAATEEETVYLENANYETVLSQISEAKKNSTLFEYLHHRSKQRMAINPDRIIKVVERP